VTKEQAILKVLRILNSRLLVANKANRDEALTLAEEHGITAKDLIEVWTKIAERV